MELEQIFGANVRAVRKARRLTQAKLAELSELSTTSIGQIERGETGPSFNSIKRIAAALDVEPTSLFANEPPVAPPTKRARAIHRLTARITRLNERELDVVERVIRVALE